MTGMLGMLRHLHHDFVGEGANHDSLHHAFQVLGNVVHRLPLAEADLGRREIERMPAELLHTHVERHARAQRRLLEDHRQRLALQRAGEELRFGFHLAGHMQEVPYLLRREVTNRKEVFWRT